MGVKFKLAIAREFEQQKEFLCVWSLDLIALSVCSKPQSPGKSDKKIFLFSPRAFCYIKTSPGHLLSWCVFNNMIGTAFQEH